MLSPAKSVNRLISKEALYREVWGATDAHPNELQPFYNAMSSLKEKIAGTNVEIAHEKSKGYTVFIKP